MPGAMPTPLPRCNAQRGLLLTTMGQTGFDIVVRTPTASALYVLNHKRSSLADLEYRFGVNISVEADESVGGLLLVIDKSAPSTRLPMGPKPSALPDFDESDPDVPLEEEADEEVISEDSDSDNYDGETAASSEPRDGSEKRGKRRRRRRGRGRDGDGAEARAEGEIVPEAGAADDGDSEEPNGSSVEAGDKKDGDRKKRRRGRRGGRRGKNEDGSDSASGSEEVSSGDLEAATVTVAAADAVAAQPVDIAEDAPKPKRSRARKPKAELEAADAVAAEAAPVAEPEAAEPVKKPRARKTAVKAAAEAEAPAVVSEPVVSSSSAEPDASDGKPRKGGWWQRKGFF